MPAYIVREREEKSKKRAVTCVTRVVSLAFDAR